MQEVASKAGKDGENLELEKGVDDEKKRNSGPEESASSMVIIPVPINPEPMEVITPTVEVSEVNSNSGDAASTEEDVEEAVGLDDTEPSGDIPEVPNNAEQDRSGDNGYFLGGTQQMFNLRIEPPNISINTLRPKKVGVYTV